MENIVKNKKVVLITGASSGMGKETAIKLIRDGYIVYGAARRVEKMDDLVKLGGHAVKLDITREDQSKEAVNRIIAEQGRIDILINNAGFGMYGAIEDTTIEDAKYQFDVNIFGLARITKLVLPFMRETKSGRIINISSIGGKIYSPMGAWYHATKHALEGWSDCLRLEVKQFGIDVVLVEPGLIATEFDDVMSKPMIKRSGQGAYGKMARLTAEMSAMYYGKKGKPSPPSVIADVIIKAIKAGKPKTRYAAGRMAKMMLFFRNFFSDRFFDNLLLNMIQFS